MRSRRSVALAIAVSALGAACASPSVVLPPTPVAVTLAEATVPESVDAYRNAGFIVGEGAIPFVGMVRFAATEYLDSTSVIVALSIPPRSLSFVRTGERYAAFYAMRIDLLRGDAIVRTERPSGEVRVAGFAETTRGDEGVIFQRSFRIPPGTYALRLTAQDSISSGSGTASATIAVPTLSEGSTAPLVPIFGAESRQTRSTALAAIVNPRATVRFGRDSVLRLYTESYGAGTPDTVLVIARRGSSVGPVLLVDTTAAPARAAVRSIQIALPVARLGLGPVHLSAETPGGSRLDSTTGFVTLGIDVPVSSVSELAEALRNFVGETELQRFRGASEAARPAQWAALVRRTDPNPATPDNEALLEYARRLRVAERLFRSGTRHGWQTDRGAVLAALGEPDTMSDPPPPDPSNSPRFITWEYRRHRQFLLFTDAVEPGSWKLSPVSEADFRALTSLLGPCVGCR